MRASYGTSSVPYFILRGLGHGNVPRLPGGNDGNTIPLTRPWRKGQSYGTMLVDLERHVPVDVLQDASADSFAAWLKEHPRVELITRDRAGIFTDGANGRRKLPLSEQILAAFWLIL